MLTASDLRHLARAAPDRTIAVVSPATSQRPHGPEPAVAFPAIRCSTSGSTALTAAERNVYLDAESLADRCFGSHLPANLILVGAA